MKTRTVYRISAFSWNADREDYDSIIIGEHNSEIDAWARFCALRVSADMPQITLYRITLCTPGTAEFSREILCRKE